MTNDLFFTYSIIASAAQLRMNPDMGRFEFTRGLFKKKKNTFFPFEILN
jgi:hypothetical protein